jgi:hypothetical protein
MTRPLDYILYFDCNDESGNQAFVTLFVTKALLVATVSE